jgi:outer membrane usher protein FimD/PapC
MSQKIKLDFEIPQGYYTQEELNNYIKNSISNLLSNYTVNAYSSTQGNITIPLKNVISSVDVDIEDID